MSTTQPTRPTGGSSYQDVQAGPEFAELKRRFRRFVFPLTALFLAWYFLFVLLSAYAPDFMGHELFGRVNVGIVFGLLQFVSTFAITIAYARWADRELDPAATALRERIEGSAE